MGISRHGAYEPVSLGHFPGHGHLKSVQKKTDQLSLYRNPHWSWNYTSCLENRLAKEDLCVFSKSGYPNGPTKSWSFLELTHHTSSILIGLIALTCQNMKGIFSHFFPVRSHHHLDLSAGVELCGECGWGCGDDRDWLLLRHDLWTWNHHHRRDPGNHHDI